MATAYTKEFLVSAFVSRYASTFTCGVEFEAFKQKMGYDHFDKVGRDEFRKHTCLDAAAIKEYKDSLK